jgi:hypothetical protein
MGAKRGVKMEWIKMNNNPPLRRVMLLQIEADPNSGVPACVVAGYLKRWSEGGIYHVIPGVDLGNTQRNVTHYSDCLGDDFQCPLWENKAMNKT